MQPKARVSWQREALEMRFCHKGNVINDQAVVESDQQLQAISQNETGH